MRALYFATSVRIRIVCDCGEKLNAPGMCIKCDCKWAVNTCIINKDPSALYAWVVKATH